MDAIVGSLISLIILFFLKPFIKCLYFAWKMVILVCTSVDLEKKFGNWAVVTGSTDGIGKEYAKELAKKGINVILISRSFNKLKITESEIRALYPDVQVKTIQADFSLGKDEFEKIKYALKDIPIGILVNNVGKLTECPMYFDEISENDLWDMINVNIASTTLMTHFIIGKMKERGKGAIVNVCSGTDSMPLPLMSFYSASKSLVRFLSEAIRTEYSKYGLVVQTLSPFYVTTNMVSYSKFIKGHQIICPNAATYAKSAVNSLGKLDSTAGYWIHDILIFCSSFLPMWLRIKISIIINSTERKNYFKTHKEVNP